MPELMEGLVQIYTGTGKGKTTAALGLAMRAAGHGLHVCIIQFMKSTQTGERTAIMRLAPEIELYSFAAEQWGDRSQDNGETPWWKLPPSEEDRLQAQEGMVFARRIVTGGEWNMVVLDEIFPAISCGLVQTDEVLGLICAKPSKVELVLTGREAPEDIIKMADLVTEMVEVKHPLIKGIKARKGIEY